MSHRIGSPVTSVPACSFDLRLGEVDLICRSLETEMLEQPPRDGELDLRFNYLMVLSEWWIGSSYAVCYTLKDRKILTAPDFLKLANDLRMIRVQIEKYEVPLRESCPIHCNSPQLSCVRTRKNLQYTNMTRRTERFRLENLECGKYLTSTPMRPGWYERLELSGRMLSVLDPQQSESA